MDMLLTVVPDAGPSLLPDGLQHDAIRNADGGSWRFTLSSASACWPRGPWPSCFRRFLWRAILLFPGTSR